MSHDTRPQQPPGRPLLLYQPEHHTSIPAVPGDRLRGSPALPIAKAVCAVFADLLYPRVCCGCDALLAPGLRAEFCTSCLSRIRPLGEPACRRCGLPGPTSAEPACPLCIADPPAFTRVRSWAYYSTDSEEKNPMARALWALKYARRLDIGHRVARVFASQLPFRPGEHELVVPVPLDPARLRWRGFNHATILAVPVARHLGAALCPRALRRTRPTPPQVSLPQAERHANVRGAFAVGERRRIVDRQVLVVDDVYTTGATAGECAVVLRAAGALSVDVVTVARAVLS